jgi:hypothetical protein
VCTDEPTDALVWMEAGHSALKVAWLVSILVQAKNNQRFYTFEI